MICVECGRERRNWDSPCTCPVGTPAAYEWELAPLPDPDILDRAPAESYANGWMLRATDPETPYDRNTT